MEHTMELDNQVLLSAVERMGRENSRESREAVLDLVISEARLLAPVEIDPPPESGEADQAAAGGGHRHPVPAAGQPGGTALLPRLYQLARAAEAVRPQKPADPGAVL